MSFRDPNDRYPRFPMPDYFPERGMTEIGGAVAGALAEIERQPIEPACKFCRGRSCVVCRGARPSLIEVGGRQQDAKEFVRAVAGGKNEVLAKILANKEFDDEALYLIGLAIEYGRVRGDAGRLTPPAALTSDTQAPADRTKRIEWLEFGDRELAEV